MVLGQVHDLVVRRVGLVQLEHGELGVVPRRHALVAEVAVDLVDALEAADDQALEVQLRRDAQEQVEVERVVVGHERLAAAPPGMACIIGVSTSRKRRASSHARMARMILRALDEDVARVRR